VAELALAVLAAGLDLGRDAAGGRGDGRASSGTISRGIDLKRRRRAAPRVGGREAQGELRSGTPQIAVSMGRSSAPPTVARLAPERMAVTLVKLPSAGSTPVLYVANQDGVAKVAWTQTVTWICGFFTSLVSAVPESGCRWLRRQARRRAPRACILRCPGGRDVGGQSSAVMGRAAASMKTVRRAAAEFWTFVSASQASRAAPGPRSRLMIAFGSVDLSRPVLGSSSAARASRPLARAAAQAAIAGSRRGFGWGACQVPGKCGRHGSTANSNPRTYKMAPPQIRPRWTPARWRQARPGWGSRAGALRRGRREGRPAEEDFGVVVLSSPHSSALVREAA